MPKRRSFSAEKHILKKPANLRTIFLIISRAKTEAISLRTAKNSRENILGRVRQVWHGTLLVKSFCLALLAS